MTQTLEEATKALTDYITGLPTEAREKAEAYQAGLVKEAETHPGGMLGVITSRLMHNNMLLLESMNEVVEDLADVVAQSAIKTASKLQ